MNTGPTSTSAGTRGTGTRRGERWIVGCVLAVGGLSGGSVSGQEGPEVVGTWAGVLAVAGQELRIVFHVMDTDDGLQATMDSPDQGAMGIPVGSTALDGRTLVFDMSALPGSPRYSGEVSEDGNAIAGSFQQFGQDFNLDLVRGEAAPARTRPQDPVDPLPYVVEDVTFESSAAGVTLAGTLTLPPGPGPFPGAILVSGSGPQNRNEELMNHRPFLVLADHMTRSGIAVLRYDDRGVGASTGSFATATSRDFAEDARAAVHYLASRAETDGGAVGIIGHSEGGLIAPMVASESSEVAFIVLMAGPGVTGEEILYLQGALIARAGGVPEEGIEFNRTLQNALFDILRETDDPSSVLPALRAELERTAATLSPSEREQSGLGETGITQQLTQLSSPWFHYFLFHDPVPALRQVTVPVLAVNGTKDLQVPPRENLSAIQAALEAGGNPDVTIQALEGLNHLFQTAVTGAPSEYVAIDETMAPLALTMMSEWITERFGRGGSQGSF